MTLKRFLHLVGIAIGVGACSAGGALRADSNSIGNACTSDEECGSDGHCTDGLCEAKENGLGQVLLEVVAPSGFSSGEYGEVRYLQLLKLDNGGTLDIELDVVAELSVAVMPPSEKCAPIGLDDAGLLPIRVKASLDSGINGINTSTLRGESSPIQRSGTLDNRVTLAMAPGTVDLYIEPIIETDINGSTDGGPSECDLAPILAIGQSISPGRVLLSQRLAIAERLDLDVVIPPSDSATTSLEGWSVDLVEPLGGRRLSNKSVLQAATTGTDGSVHYPVHLAYHAVIGSGAERIAGTELIRLTPPADLLSPKYYVARSGLDLFGTGALTFSQVRQIPPAVTVQGIVELEPDGTPVIADVVAVLAASARASGGAMASFQATTRTDDTGTFTLNLIAGDYSVVAIPVEPMNYASRQVSWTVASSPSAQAGKLIQVSPMSMIAGSAYSASSQAPIANSTLVALPTSIGERPTFLDDLLGVGRPMGVRSQMATSDGAGAFEFPVDPGRYDIAVRPGQESGYPWAIRPAFLVEEGTKGLSIAIRNPVAYAGQVTVPGLGSATARIAMPNATVRFFALFDARGQLAEDGSSIVSAVEIGQTRTEEDGTYRLLLPDRID